MADKNSKQFEVVYFQTDTFGNRVVGLDGEIVATDNPIYKNGTTIFMEELGLKGFKFESQIVVHMPNGGYRINWVFQREIEQT